MNYIDVEAMKTMMKTSGDMFAITNEEPIDPLKFITPIIGPINNWTWVRFSKNMGKIFCNASSNALFDNFNKMNFNLAYFHVSHNIEILHLNGSMNLKMKLINNWKRKLNLWNQFLKLLVWAIMRIHA